MKLIDIVISVLLTIVLILHVIYVSILQSHGVKSLEAARLTKIINEYDTKNEELREKILDYSSFKSIEERALKMGFEYRSDRYIILYEEKRR